MRPKTTSLTLKLIALLLAVLALGGCRRQSAPTAEEGAAAIIQNKGSDTMVNLALAWAEQYQLFEPHVRVAVTGGGTGTGIAALINGTVDIANASRRIKAEELEEAQGNGIEPVEFVVARDAIAVIVHPSNPVDELTLQQISDIYSGKITNWQAVGGEDRPIVLLSRETNSGTHVYFLEEVLRLGQSDNKTLFSPDTLLLPSSEGIGVEVRQNPNAIGYDGLGYVTADMKTLAVSRGAGQPYYPPTAKTVNAGEYPIARDLYMYTAGEPQGQIKAYLEWILGPAAQQTVLELGFVPISDTGATP
ncbi:MAG TPA: phosphate ABC transporter substrate-binding protein [Anaerolineae bacterium]|nr:phosphate ABC transporter substrate-binding protein [Anaerolineae bacterium]HQH37395.1 phosphate ABC transporter substrate-binding protein [Anaerolineae bacterium]